MKFRLSLLGLLFAAMASANGGGDEKISTNDYISQYSSIAVKEMKLYGIPASITLAQGILESGSGNSYLAREANNHFGIKCHLDWKGRKVYKDDDAKNECFRSYKDPIESFRDHSLFLTQRSRYAFLFEEDPTDYKAWAKGLKKAGYATNRKYPQLLIDLIERYELYKYDQEIGSNKPESPSPTASLAVQVSPNRIEYVVVGAGDSFESIAQAAGKRVEDLLKYNELSFDSKPQEGQVIYLQPKRKKAGRDTPEYTVQPGDDMYFISQKFGVKMKNLYQMNDLKVGEQPKVGSTVKLR